VSEALLEPNPLPHLGMNTELRIGWWNNHDGGFIKMAIIGGVKPGIGRDGQEAFLSRDNSTSLEKVCTS
jgi:hypothetical protein